MKWNNWVGYPGEEDKKKTKQSKRAFERSSKASKIGERRRPESRVKERETQKLKIIGAKPCSPVSEKKLMRREKALHRCKNKTQPDITERGVKAALGTQKPRQRRKDSPSNQRKHTRRRTGARNTNKKKKKRHVGKQKKNAGTKGGARRLRESPNHRNNQKKTDVSSQGTK